MAVLVEHTVRTETLYEGRVVHLERLAIRTDDGRTSFREIVRHGDAAVVLARRPDGRFVFVRQYRKAVEQPMIEAVAGGVEAGESPEDCARRELLEESGHRAVRIEALGPLICCPGYSSEVLHGFLAEVGEDVEALAPDADENLDVLLLTPAEVEREIAEGRILDGKTLALWLLHRLRKQP